MSNLLFYNDSKTTLGAPVAPGDATITLASGAGALFSPGPTGAQYFTITLSDALTGLNNEICKCTNVTGDVLTVVRAQEGTTAQSWLVGDNAQGRITAGDLMTLGSEAATSADKLTTARTIAMSGDATWSVSFDGSANVTAAGTLATVNLNVGGFGSSSVVPAITVDGKGRITAAANVAISGTAVLDTVGTTQGDLVFRDASAWSRLLPGAAGQVLVTGGPAANPAWGAPTPYAVNLTATANWTVPAWALTTTVFRFRGVAPGGGAGGGQSGGNGNGGAGGASGDYFDLFIRGFTAGQNVSVTVGSHGTGGTNNAAGTPGGNLSLAYATVSFLVAHGGPGGGFGSATVTGAGAIPVGATLSFGASGLSLSPGYASMLVGAAPGEDGTYLGNSISWGGRGGGNPFGPGARGYLAGPNSSQLTGATASGWGAGGGGGAESGGTQTVGGDGGAGYLEITSGFGAT